MGRKNQVLLYLLVQLFLVALQGVAAKLAWERFHDAISACAVGTLYGIPNQSRAQQADAVVKGILDMEDSDLHKRVRDYEYGFTAILWTAGIPRSYQDILIEGDEWRPLVKGRAATSMRNAHRGAQLMDRCHHSYTDEAMPHLGYYGWPCPAGCAIFVEAPGSGVNMVISYFPFKLRTSANSSPIQTLNTFKHAIKTCTSADKLPRLSNPLSSDVIDLTTVAGNFHEALPDACGANGRSSHAGLSFKAVICIPIYEPDVHIPQSLVPDFFAPNVGVSAAAGQLAIDYKRVHVNGKPGNYLRLMFIAAIPHPPCE